MNTKILTSLLRIVFTVSATALIAVAFGVNEKTDSFESPASLMAQAARDFEPRAAAADDASFSTPTRLSETGLYKRDGSITVDPRNQPFTPQYPLWTDGAAKARWIYLPEGTTIDVGDIDAWQFPVGTKLWKEFAFDGKKVETRMLWKQSTEDWVFATYVWNEEQTDALLAPEAGVPGVVTLASGKQHSIPSMADCNACHRGSPAVVLGFSALQLSDDRDPLAPHSEPLRPRMVTLRTLVESDRLEPARPDLVTNPPRIRTDDPIERAALGYLSGNCGSCHNNSGPLARLGMVLLHDDAGEANAPEPALLTAVDATGRFLVPGVAADSSRLVVPGAPERSALLYRLQSRRPSSQMPPVGSVTVDKEAAELVNQWIMGLGLKQPDQEIGTALIP